MKKIITTAILSFIFLLGGLMSARAATLTVTKIADTNDNVCDADCSLREAIFAAAASGDTIEFASPLFDTEQTIALTLGELYTNKTLTINGRAANLTFINGNNLFRVFDNDGNLTLNGLNVTNGRDTGAGGAGIYNNGTMTINKCAITNNRVLIGAIEGGGGIVLAAGKTLTVSNSTISGNYSVASGGGIVARDNSNLTLENVTMTRNRLEGNYGGGLYTTGAVRIYNSTITENSTSSSGGGIALVGNSFKMIRNSIITGNNSPFDTNIYNTGSGYGNNVNIIGGNAGLLPLGYYGGTTQTYILASGSPAINAGNDCVLVAGQCGDGNAALPTDQRGAGYPRKIGTAVDLGATEGEIGYVTNANSSGAGSLSQAISDVPSGSTIIFDPTFFNQPRTITGSYYINKNLTINGPGANLLTIDANNAGRVLVTQGSMTVNVSGIRFTRGRVVPPDASGAGILVFQPSTLNATGIIVDNCSTTGGDGGGIYVEGTLNLTDSTVENNSAPGSGGIYVEAGRTATLTRSIVRQNTASGSSGGIGNNGTLNFYDSTLNNNTAPLGGGLGNGGFANFANSTVSGNRSTGNKGAGIYNNSGATVHLLNTTITNNQSDSFAGAGIWNENFSSSPITVRARNTIIAGNISGNGSPVDYVGSITDLGNNLINNNNPGLAPLGNYGGATPTHALLSNSPALNTGSDCVLTMDTCGVGHSAFPNDQRSTNTPRKIGTSVDIGAFEQNITFNQSNLPNGNQNAMYNQQVSVTRLSNLGESVSANLAPFSYTIIGGALPPGLLLDPNTGIISGSPTAQGTFDFIVKATDTDGSAGASAYTIQVFAPTAASVSISGRILTSDGRGLRNARVVLTDSNGNSRYTVSSSFGFYMFEEVEVGETYVLSVESKRFQFAPQIISVKDEIAELNFYAAPE